MARSHATRLQRLTMSPRGYRVWLKRTSSPGLNVADNHDAEKGAPEWPQITPLQRQRKSPGELGHLRLFALRARDARKPHAGLPQTSRNSRRHALLERARLEGGERDALLTEQSHHVLREIVGVLGRH